MRLIVLIIAAGLLSLSGIAEDLVDFEQIHPDLELGDTRPDAFAVPPDGSKRLFVVCQRGKIWVLPKDRRASNARVFLDFSGREMEANKFEEGLLGLAFHPDYKTNGKFYVYYSQQKPKRSVISELKVSNHPDKADVSTERILMEIRQPFWNHNSGNLLFGKDGYLYIGSGDGGKADDIRRLAQNPWMLNGKILRIDVNGTRPGREYAIPKDNPLVGEEGVREEIYATGIRNPWGLHEDHQTGQFWFADVGQNKFEEINLLKKGGNYGWSYREGFEKFERRHDTPPKSLVFVEPVVTYGRDAGISVTGGVVYRGHRVPALKDHYIYADWGSGTFWAMPIDQPKAGKEKIIWKRPISEDKKNKTSSMQPTAIALDAEGEIVVADWNGKLFEMR